ncbi:NAD(P)-dependent dehydrogenase (short-subunit alcohol dehydrogenase family) [Hephaestia caeni]|uniref:NAD(P)-dependent dehydrogenase (Short-subunit alcohol dehydrogenase family) n=1 Tax=Hephaestia caeni TaxID=645617 RepID=A0A397NPU9_9SPHN|nr:SDR family NAD(P)-dependent oxidoreductase [Hephaestia caeni]RIA37703.1 NAD(P)-dependent dehydrogenase (short-subunit alcohol dehydrogenase family) [Hephaestia caeni]
MRFAGKRAVVTGGASGIGRATALRLAEEGAEVLIGDVDEAGGGALAQGSGGRIAFQRTDVTKVDDIAALVAAADAAGGLDIMVNNAGAGGARDPIDTISADDWDRTQALLLRSVAMGIRHAAPLMAARGGGAIVNTSSVSALGSGYAPTAYSTAKAGVLHLTKMAAADLAQHHIRVNAVVPGFIATNIFTASLGIAGAAQQQANAMIAAGAAKAQPIQRTGTPEDVAAAIAFLASDDASFITGTSILVDGGLTIGPRHSWDPDTPSLFAALEAFAK